MTDANDILMGGGVPTAKFTTVGTTVTGVVAREPEARQQRDFRTQVPETWKDGSPKMMVVVQLTTAERDPEKADDDGTRALYIQGKNLTEAVRQAVRASGANGIHTGGTLTVQYVADGPKENDSLNPPKLYAAWYQPPAVSFTGTTPPAPAPAAPQQYAPGFAPQPPFAAPATPLPGVPATPPPAAPVAQSATVASMSGMPAGFDPVKWAQLSQDQKDRVRAALAAPAAAAGY